MKISEVAKASIVVVLLVCWEEEKENGVLRVPSEYGSEGDFGIVVNRWYKEEPILVVADRGRKELTVNDGFYLVMMCYDNGGAGGGLKVERGSALKDKGVKESLGMVVLVVRPPK
ncbi:Rik1-associated factor 1 [Ancistrocladus abbreviatus]